MKSWLYIVNFAPPSHFLKGNHCFYYFVPHIIKIIQHSYSQDKTKSHQINWIDIENWKEIDTSMDDIKLHTENWREFVKLQEFPASKGFSSKDLSDNLKAKEGRKSIIIDRLSSTQYPLN